MQERLQIPISTVALGIIQHTTHALKIAQMHPARSRIGIFAKMDVNFGKVRVNIYYNNTTSVINVNDKQPASLKNKFGNT